MGRVDRPKFGHTKAVTKRKVSKTGQETRDRIIDAALTTVRNEGLVGTSARAIARTGDFNQALVFYHFGSIEELLFAAIERASDRRLAKFEGLMAEVDTLAGLVEVAKQLHTASDDIDQPALAALVAGWSTSSDLGPKIIELLKPWDDMVAAALRRALSNSPLAPMVPFDDFAHLISSLFLGMEMMSRLDPEDGRTEKLFQSLSAFATLGGPIIEQLKLDGK